ncbi:DNA-directed RNA polymerase subunit K [Candidatus Woesearchaeota archaeon CG10_big_fil_rev_8_21_14_0_10_44_13]|nr:MAG: DNA-directed RNA polymerase subunit K [Candidatus Woesearchaeota archaeon CG10_big_fil_rev_8_21_14_0_10_44_13]
MERPEKYTKYERARMLGSRALQLSMGAPFLVKLDKEGLEKIKYDPLEIAKMEFDKGVLPLTVRRPLPMSMKREVKEEAKAA